MHAQSNRGDLSTILSIKLEAKGNVESICNVIKIILAIICTHIIHLGTDKKMVEDDGAQPLPKSQNLPPNILALTLGTSASRGLPFELLKILYKIF